VFSIKLVMKGSIKTTIQKISTIREFRGQGLFLEIELVAEHLHPFVEKIDYVVYRMKEFGILMSSDGPDHNVIKIKPSAYFYHRNYYILFNK
jgi:4-aminobutyrate aminotransferase-like enzyme